MELSGAASKSHHFKKNNMAEFTNITVSGDIQDGLATAGQPAEPIEAGTCFWDTSTTALFLAAIASPSGAGYRCVPDLGIGIKDYSFSNPDLVKAWAIREIKYWLDGTMQAVTYDYTATVFTITIAGDDWTGTDVDETQAIGKAFVALLNDVNFSDYLA